MDDFSDRFWVGLSMGVFLVFVGVAVYVYHKHTLRKETPEISQRELDSTSHREFSTVVSKDCDIPPTLIHKPSVCVPRHVFEVGKGSAFLGLAFPLTYAEQKSAPRLPPARKMSEINPSQQGLVRAPAHPRVYPLMSALQDGESNYGPIRQLDVLSL